MSDKKFDWLEESFGGGDEVYIDVDDIYDAFQKLEGLVYEGALMRFGSLHEVEQWCKEKKIPIKEAI